MSACKFSKLLTSAPNLCWLVWLFKHGHLTNIFDGLKIKLDESYLQSDDPFDGVFEKKRHEILTEIKFDNCSYDIDIDDLSSAIDNLITEEFQWPEESDSHWIGDILLTEDRLDESIISHIPDEIFLNNWKFKWFIQGSLAPYYLILYFLKNPLISPVDIDYSRLKNIIKKIYNHHSGPVNITTLIDELNQRQIYIDKNYLTSIILNEEDFILIHTEVEMKFAVIINHFKAWDLAIELFESDEFVKTKGLEQYTQSDFYNLELSTSFSTLKNFLEFHNDSIDWSIIDPLELCLKIRFSQSKPKKTLQSIPIKLHAFICSWITKNNSLWINRRSKSILGREYRFKADEISSGALLVYGNLRHLNDPNQLALVTKNMVSENSQIRGKIHPSKIISPFRPFDFRPNSYDIVQLFKNIKTFEDYGVVDIDAISKKIVINEKAEIKPYNIKIVYDYLLENLPKFMTFIGKGLVADTNRYPGLEFFDSFKLKRKFIYDSSVPHGYSHQRLLDELDINSGIIMNKLHN